MKKFVFAAIAGILAVLTLSIEPALASDRYNVRNDGEIFGDVLQGIIQERLRRQRQKECRRDPWKCYDDRRYDRRNYDPYPYPPRRECYYTPYGVRCNYY